MTDEEFEVLDELYFVLSWDELQNATGKPKEQLIKVLIQLLEKGWIRVYRKMDDELSLDEIDLKDQSASYFYLASKEGLLAHNTTG